MNDEQMSDEQRRINGRKTKATFDKDVSSALDRLEAEIKQQASSAFPKRVKVTQESVAKAAGHHRTTFNGHYHKSLRDRVRDLRRLAKDPKRVHVEVVAPTDIVRDEGKDVGLAHPRISALLKENQELKLENRLLRRQRFQLQATGRDADNPGPLPR
jgi:hypothetical protein